MQLNEFQKITVDQLIDKYVAYIEGNFGEHLKDEAYKFQAVSTFRRELDLGATDLHKMFERAFKDMKNLVGSGQYFPAKMLLQFIDRDKELMRATLKKLLDGEGSGGEKIDSFKDIVELKLKTPDGQTYFDSRFLGVLLASARPDRYIPVKMTEYKKFAQIIGYDLGINKNIFSQGERYEKLSAFGSSVREVLQENSDFIRIHSRLVGNYEFKDEYFGWGTLDFIFNVVRREYSSSAELEKQNKLKKQFEESRVEAEDDFILTDETRALIVGKDKNTLLEEAKQFISTEPGFVEKKGTIRIRRDNAVQKERVKSIEDYMCQVCNTEIEYMDSKGIIKKYAEADHIIPKADGGSEALGNLWVLCPNCHTKKTLGVIVVDLKEKIVRSNGVEIKIRDAHLGWYK